MSEKPQIQHRINSPETGGRSRTERRAIAFDYDGTIAERGRVAESTKAALRSLHEGGFQLILVSGRRLESLRSLCDGLDLFDAVVAENGAVSFCPQSGVEHLIAPPVNRAFLAELKEKLPKAALFVGQSMVATEAENVDLIRAIIDRGGYDLDVVGCGGRVMILASGVSKGSGLAHAVARLGLRRDQVVAVGDEENDIALFEGCGLAVAVRNATPKLKAEADLVLPGECGQSIWHLADMLLADRP